MREDRPFKSIGSVLDTLKVEFPDISVSKIRFLESEGLLEPERTSSGYRKFYTKDVERLRLILRLQRDAFLPLKVIKERLDAGITSIPTAASSAPVPADRVAAADATPAPQPEAVAPVQATVPEEDIFAEETPVQLTERDLADATGLEVSQIGSLAEFGVLCVHGSNGSSYYDQDDVRIGRIARELLELGIEPRHMKTLRRSADQEVDLFEQLVTPAMRNRRPEARADALDTLRQLTHLSRSLRTALVRRSLRSVIGGDRT